jgi:hypothetical protein
MMSKGELHSDCGSIDPKGGFYFKKSTHSAAIRGLSFLRGAIISA